MAGDPFPAPETSGEAGRGKPLGRPDSEEARSQSSATSSTAQLQASGSVDRSSEHTSPPKTPSAVSLAESVQSTTHSEYTAGPVGGCYCFKAAASPFTQFCLRQFPQMCL